MVHRSKVVQGIAAYVDRDLVPGLAGSWKAWVLGSIAGIAISRADRMLDALSRNPVVTAMGLMEGENIDVEAIFAELRKQAQKSNATIDIPIIGAITFSSGDVENLYRYIMGA